MFSTLRRPGVDKWQVRLSPGPLDGAQKGPFGVKGG